MGGSARLCGFDFPDLQSAAPGGNSGNDITGGYKKIEENGIYGPEPVMNLQYASQRNIQAYLEGQQDGWNWIN